MRGGPAIAPRTDAEQALAAQLQRFDLSSLRREFTAQGGFLYLPQFLSAELSAQLLDAVAASHSAVNRNYLPGHKRGGSVSRHAIDELAPAIAQLYRSPALIEWLGRLAGESLQPSPAEDAHAYALYLYTQPGDHIGWHYDTSYYAGRRYTLLFGVIDQSSCQLEYQLHTRSSTQAVEDGALQIAPGGLVFFDGDAVRHRITPLAANERRVSLTFEYLTDTRIHRWWRLISDMKDAFGYFGFRQVFRRRPPGAP